MRNQVQSENGKKWIKKEMRPYRGYVFFLTCLTVISTGLSLAFAYMVQFLVNSASDKNTQLLWIFSAVVLAVLLVRIGLQTFLDYAAEHLRAKITAELRTRMFGKILRSDYAKIQEYHSGDLLNRLTSDIQEMSMTTVSLLPAIVGMIVQCLGAIAALLTIDPLFTLIYVLCGCAFAGITAFFRKQIKKRQKEVLEVDGKARAFMQESMSSVMTIKSYGAEAKTEQKAQGISEIYYQKRMRRMRLRSLMNVVFELLGNFGLVFAVIWCSVSVLNGNTNYGSILSVILLLMQLKHPFSAFSSIVPVYYARLTSGERLNEIEALPCETIETNKTNEAETNLYDELQDISMESVAFTYGRDEVLKNANATIKKGEIVCLTGASGSGKSTLFKLLLNVFAPTGGGLWLDDGKGNKKPLTAKERSLFAYVPQGKFLFSGTIYENLTFFAGEILDMEKRIEKALEVACAQFVWELPQGLQTPLTEGGGGLSEGQMQRLAVARAILSDRPILLLDEATSALDGETETKLLENVRKLKEKTCLIVTHRPAALVIADRVLSVEGGKIVEK